MQDRLIRETSNATRGDFAQHNFVRKRQKAQWDAFKNQGHWIANGDTLPPVYNHPQARNMSFSRMVLGPALKASTSAEPEHYSRLESSCHQRSGYPQWLSGVNFTQVENARKDAIVRLERQQSAAYSTVRLGAAVHRFPRKPLPLAKDQPDMHRQREPQVADISSGPQTSPGESYPDSSSASANGSAHSHISQHQHALPTPNLRAFAPPRTSDSQLPSRPGSAILGLSLKTAGFSNTLPPDLRPDDKPVTAQTDPTQELPKIVFDTKVSLHNNDELSSCLTTDESGLERFKGKLPTTIPIANGDLKKVIGTE